MRSDAFFATSVDSHERVPSLFELQYVVRVVLYLDFLASFDIIILEVYCLFH